jgi:hypothetical protein
MFYLNLVVIPVVFLVGLVLGMAHGLVDKPERIVVKYGKECVTEVLKIAEGMKCIKE